jgi:hypothetical protein
LDAKIHELYGEFLFDLRWEIVNGLWGGVGENLARPQLRLALLRFPPEVNLWNVTINVHCYLLRLFASLTSMRPVRLAGSQL